MSPLVSAPTRRSPSARRPLATLAFGVAASVLMLGGCATLAPRYERPAAPVPTTWPQGGVYPARTGAADSAVADLRWRDMFVDPKLQAVIDQALANNRDLRIAVLNVQQSRAQYRIQRAALLPTLGADANLTRAHGSAAALGGSGAGSFDERLYSVNASISNYELDLFGRVRSLTRAELERYLATEEARRAAQITLIAETASNYLTLAADRERLAVAQETERSQDASLTLTRRRFEGGAASELDLRQAEAAAAQARADVAAASSLAAQDLNALNLVVGAPVSGDLLPGGLEGPAPVRPDVPAGLSSQVLLQRPDVLQAEHQLKAYNANIGAARAAFFPILTLTASGGTQSSQLSGLFSGGSGAWSFVPTLAAPIFDWGANQARLNAAKAQRDIALAQYEKSVQTAFREVADALARRGTIGEQLAAQDVNVTSAAKALSLAEARYRQGVDPYLNTLVAQRTLYAAQQSRISAKLALYSNLVTLYETLGGGVR